MPYQKTDHGKLDWSILPWDALEPVVRVFEFGAAKYERDGFRDARGDASRDIFRRIWAALFRHAVAALKNPTGNDAESGLPHLAHAACCVLMLIYWSQQIEE